VLAIAAAACGGPVDLPLDRTLIAFVGGSVSDPEGRPVRGVRIDSELFETSSCGGSEPRRNPPVFTNALGLFTYGFGVPFTDPFEGCVNLTFTPPSESGLMAAERTGIGVSFVSDLERRDSVVIAVTLPR
jgi:hypothetical protein